MRLGGVPRYKASARQRSNKILSQHAPTPIDYPRVQDIKKTIPSSNKERQTRAIDEHPTLRSTRS